METGLDIKHTVIFTKNLEYLEDPSKKFIINQGGRGSSKTYSLLQLLIWYALVNKNKIISVVRKTFPALKFSAMKDFIEILKELEIYSEERHNKTDHHYTFDSGSEIEFFSVDNSQKMRGRKRDILYCNEVNELSLDDYIQLNLRTNEKVFLDFNPSDDNHFVYSIIKKQNAAFIQSTYKDNPFLPKRIVEEIEDLINQDENYYKVFCLGEKGISNTSVYNRYSFSPYKENKDIYYGLDFGSTHPTALIEISPFENTIYAKQLIYKTKLTSSDLIKELNDLKINKQKEIIADNARPEMIEEIKRAGYNIKAADKGQGSVLDGINAVKSYNILIDNESIDLMKEMSNYKFKIKGDIILPEPVKVYDDAVDALRYVVHFYYKLNNKGNPFSNFSFVTLKS